MRNKKGPKISERLRESVRWQPETEFTAVRVEIFGENLVTIENHKGILEYGDTQMRINCGRRILRVSGIDLTLHAMTEDAIAIGGQILSVEYLD